MNIDKILKCIDPNIVLDDEQQKIVVNDAQNLMVIAGAGSGKTTTIMAKIKYLVDYLNVNPKEILIISFTNKTINDLKENINDKLKINTSIYTFHKLAYELLKDIDRRYRINNNFEKILTQIIKKNKDNNKMIKYLCKDKDYKKISKKYRGDYEFFIKFSIDNIKLVQVNGFNNIQNSKHIAYMSYLNNILNEYEKYMNENYELDFETLITKASLINDINVNYKYIIVDEYQDISLNRYKFLLNLRKITRAKTMVVGDDWQTIFSFAGSNINLFLNYKENTNAEALFISRTYRNSQQLIDIAGNFIMKSKNQIVKRLISSKELNNPIEIYGYKDEMGECFEKIVRIIMEKSNTILVLGRYNDDILKIRNYNFKINKDNIIYKKKKNIKIKFLTIHSAKGLGFDNVILINFEDDIMGFPSKIEELKIRKNLFNIKDNIEEERRLFYVALTRSKNKVYIITKIGHESSFMKELKDYDNVKINYNYKIIKRKK